jgi:hypothetical protein
VTINIKIQKNAVRLTLSNTFKLTPVYGIVTRDADIQGIFAGSPLEDAANGSAFFKESKKHC